ncbi:hypothetical protein [Flavobacterium davisii]|uniref:hypothetical protein n=1 Tax=Flavobacterium davisii TaxID=2906077 RepID=UPI000B4DA918|nr:hypothetical protein [Flavobacterium davisii]
MIFFNSFFRRNKNNNDVSNQFDTKNTPIEHNKTFISTGDNTVYKIIIPLTDEQRNHILKSTILLQANQLYMHYWTDNLVCEDPNDPEWQNKVMFFWKAEEPFPKKSLPPIFETFKTKYFLFSGDTSKISLQIGQAIPWFGMPGLGQKHVCEINGQKIAIPELNKQGLVEYIELTELTNDNLHILNDKENYFFLIDERITPFQNGNFYLNNKVIPIDIAYSVGGIHIVKKTRLES